MRSNLAIFSFTMFILKALSFNRGLIQLRYNRLKNAKCNINKLTRMFSVQSSQDELAANIKQVGDKIRSLKEENVDKSVLQPLIDELTSLKKSLNELNGIVPEVKNSNQAKKKGGENQQKNKSKNNNNNNNEKNEKDVDSIVITPRSEDYSAWYSDVISAADMADQSSVRGCMVIKPWGMAIWDLLRSELDQKIKDSGTQNAYFPLFIPKSFLSKEAEHVDGFAKECAVVTHHRLCMSPDGKELIPDPAAKLEEPLIVRPTSETVIWNMFGKWINSYRDLPLKINQWANVVRWELRTRPFLRSTEFLWQEGHTAHATAEDAVKTATDMLDMYASVCKDMLAMPTVKGQKSPSERFAGAEDTYTIEALMQNGWALQSGTSHFLGQNFARAFDVFFQNDKNERELVWATSWGVSTRLIGALVMTHSDDKGLVLPPAVAPVQVVLIPITKGEGDEHNAVLKKTQEISSILSKHKVRVKIDDRNNMRPGAKYFEWERKGVPLRLDIGPRDMLANKIPATIRFSGEKSSLDISDLNQLGEKVQIILNSISDDMYSKANQRLTQNTFKINSYAEMKRLMQNENNSNESTNTEKISSTSGFYLVPWKCDAANEEAIKNDCKATIRCYPLDLNKTPLGSDVKCFYSGAQATHWAIFARAF